MPVSPRESLSTLEGHDMVVAAFHLLSDGIPAATPSMPAIPTVPAVAFLDGDAMQRLVSLCRRLELRRVSLIGRAAEPDFDPALEVVDLLVDTTPGTAMHDCHPDRDITGWIDLCFDLESVLHLPVELVTPEEFAEDPPPGWDADHPGRIIELFRGPSVRSRARS